MKLSPQRYSFSLNNLDEVFVHWLRLGNIKNVHGEGVAVGDSTHVDSTLDLEVTFVTPGGSP